MADAASETVKFPNRYHIEPALVRVMHHAIQFGSPVLCSRDACVDVFSGDGPAAPFTVFTQLAQLQFWRLAVVQRADSRVDGHAGYSASSHCSNSFSSCG